jgi:phage terminase Nu1 subunit (DNA packaging protein)
MATQEQIASHLDLSRQSVAELLRREGIGGQAADLDTIRIAYIRSLRKSAAGRGTAEDEGDLRRARIREATSKAQLAELDYQERIGALVNIEDLIQKLEAWAVHARNEFDQAMHRMVMAIESQHGITVQTDVIDRETDNALRVVSSYMRYIGSSDGETGEEIITPTEDIDVGVVED